MSNYLCLLALNDLPLKEENAAKCFAKIHSVHGLQRNGIKVVQSLAISVFGKNDNENSKYCCEHTSRFEKKFICGSVELHNRQSLIELLELSDEEYRESSDVHLILLSYNKWGCDGFKRLVGNFTFVIFDGNKKVLFGVVDPLGVNSLYYRFIESRYLIISNRLRFVAQPGKLTIDNGYITAYLLNYYQRPEKTVFCESMTVPSGNYIAVTGASIRAYRYWQPIVNPGSIIDSSNIHPCLKLKSLIFQSVECRISRKSKNGILLSGGLDSSAVCCIANELLKNKGSEISAFSKVLSPENSGDFLDERKHILAVAAQERLAVNFATDVAFVNKDLLHEYFTAQYIFPHNPFAFLSKPLYQIVSADECTTLFSGFGGDETVSTEGLGSLPFLLIRFSLKDFCKNIRALSKNHNISIFMMIKGFVVKPLLPLFLIKRIQKLRGKNTIEALSNTFVRKEVLKKYLLRDYLSEKNGYTSDNYLDPRKEMQNRIINTYFRPFFDFDEYLYDIYHVKQVHPLLDKRIVEFMLSVHPREYLLEGLTRSLFRRVIKGVLPEEIRMRKDKIAFNVGVPYSSCIIESKDFIKEILLNSDSSIWNIVNRDLLEEKFFWLVENNGNNSSEKNNRLALEIGRCVNVAAFYQWHGV